MRKITVALSALALLGLPALVGVDGAARGSYHDPVGRGFGTEPCTIDGHVMPGSGVTRTVGPSGRDHTTIQAAITAAQEGDTILVHPGTYTGQVNVNKPGLRIRGTDRATVVLDGQTQARYAFNVTADRVLIENMTAHHYTHTAFYWTGVVGYWGRYLTAYSNGLYGLYAYDARCGQFDHSYGSGNADSAFYIGECFACDAVIHDVVAEQNALGYSGTNAGGNLVLRDSIWRDNGMGIVPNSLNGEAEPPQKGATIQRNLVVDNNNARVPGSGLAGQYFGVGITIAGGKANVVTGNVVRDHALAGIALTPLPDPAADPEKSPAYIASGNMIWNNTVGHDPANETYANAVDIVQGATSGPDNCWGQNHPATGQAMTAGPPLLQTVWRCNQTITPPSGDPRVEALLAIGAAGLNGRDPQPWQTWPAPTSPEAFVNFADAACDGGTDCAPTRWIPALGLS